MPSTDFAAWIDALHERYTKDLTFREIRTGVQALSSIYVERRGQIGERALDGAGKRAAFALFYSPLHFQIVAAIAREVGANRPGLDRIVDLGCGTGAASAGWATACTPPPSLAGVDRNRWAAGECRHTWAALGLHGTARPGDAVRQRLPERGGGVLAAWLLNELEPEARAALQGRLVQAAERGCRVLVVEPIARRPSPWWDEWAARIIGAGGRADTWDLEADLPGVLGELDRAAGLNHRRLKARSTYLP